MKFRAFGKNWISKVVQCQVKFLCMIFSQKSVILEFQIIFSHRLNTRVHVPPIFNQRTLNYLTSLFYFVPKIKQNNNSVLAKCFNIDLSTYFQCSFHLSRCEGKRSMSPGLLARILIVAKGVFVVESKRK